MQERQTDRQTVWLLQSQLQTWLRGNAFQVSLRRESLRVAGPKRLVLLSRAFDPNTPIFNGENPNASYLRWPAWTIKFQNPQILDFNFSLQKLSSHKKRLKWITIRTNDGLYSKKHHLKVLFKEMQFVAFFIFHMGKTRMQVKNDLRCLRQTRHLGQTAWVLGC